MRRSYLLPVLSVIPLLVAILLVIQLDSNPSPVTIVLLIIGYWAINIAYSISKKTFHPSIVIELALVSLIAFLVLSNLN